jgi:hypothetical protein
MMSAALKLHEAIDTVLADQPGGMTAREIANEVNRRKLYVKRSDGKKVKPGQITARVANRTYCNGYRKDDSGRITKRGIRATAHAVRAYWSDHSYGKEPRESPSHDPVVVPDFPRAGDRCSVWFGRVPDAVRKPIRARIAMTNAMLNAIVGHTLGVRRETSVDEEIRKGSLGFEEHNWYVTMALERPIELDEQRLTGERHWWIEEEAVEPAQDALAAEAPKAFEVIVATVAPIMESSMFEGRDRDYVYVTAPGHGPMFAPKWTGSATGMGIRSMADFPLDAIRVKAAHLDEGGPWQKLGNAMHWYEAMLREREDPLRRFLWGFICLEALVDEALKHLERPALEALRKAKASRLPISARFALVASELSPKTAMSDIEAFEKLNQARNDIAHGKQRLSDKDPPVEAMRELLPRYVTLALET